MIVIAIDGPAASGKSSVARRLAMTLGFAHVNSGSMYRAVTWEVLRRGVDPTDPRAVASCTDGLALHAGLNPAGTSFVTINGDNVESHLHDEPVNRNVSAVSTVPEVRDMISQRLREIAADRPVVMEGRDIGTAVFPSTPHKFYLDASPEIRSKRRAAQGLKDRIEERDRIDSSRKTAPLAVATDALLIDTSHLTLDGVVEKILSILASRGVVPLVEQ